VKLSDGLASDKTFRPSADLLSLSHGKLSALTCTAVRQEGFMTEWDKEVLKLRENHGWKSKPGYKIFVADQGLIRFDIPEKWLFVPGENSFKFHDRQPPDDNCTLELSLIRHSTINWAGLPLVELIKQCVKEEKDEASGPAEVRVVARPDVEIAWTEVKFTDPHEHRPTRSRTAVARGLRVHALFTFSFWESDLADLDLVWQELLRSLESGMLVKDPTIGPVPI
jgi:hypothetical protein